MTTLLLIWYSLGWAVVGIRCAEECATAANVVVSFLIVPLLWIVMSIPFLRIIILALVVRMVLEDRQACKP